MKYESKYWIYFKLIYQNVRVTKLSLSDQYFVSLQNGVDSSREIEFGISKSLHFYRIIMKVLYYFKITSMFKKYYILNRNEVTYSYLSHPYTFRYGWNMKYVYCNHFKTKILTGI